MSSAAQTAVSSLDPRKVGVYIDLHRNTNEEISIKVIRMPQVEDKVGLKRATIWRLIAAGHLPKPIKISARASGWIESEIDEFIQRRAESRNIQS